MGRNLQSSYIYKWIQKLNNQRELIKLLWVFIFIFIFYYIFYLLGNIVSYLLKLMFGQEVWSHALKIINMCVINLEEFPF